MTDRSCSSGEVEPRTLPRHWAAVLFACLCASVAGLSTSAQAPARPTFRAAVRLVDVDVVVRNEDDQFVDALTKDDFEILEDGKAQAIEALTVVNLPADRLAEPRTATASPVIAGAAWQAADSGRVYVMVLDSGAADAVQRIARQFVMEFLGPTDVMAVVHVHDRAATQGLTANRELLLASVDRFRGGGWCRPPSVPETGCPALEILKDVAINLNATTGRRKAVLFFGQGFELSTPPVLSTNDPEAQVRFALGVKALARMFEEMVRTATRNNVRVYPISPDGFRVRLPAMTGQAPREPRFQDPDKPRSEPSGGPPAGTGLEGAEPDRLASLRILASDTGGIAIANTGNYAGNFRRIVGDNSAYYVLTYNSMAEPDGRTHPIAVRLRNRPDLSVRTGRKSFAAPTPDVKGRAVALPRGLSTEARKALSAPSPAAAGPGIELFTTVFQAQSFDGSVLVGVHVPGAWLRTGANDTIELSYMAVDRWGAVRAVTRRAFTLNMGASSRAQVSQTGLRLFGRLEVPRGKYQIRVVARQTIGATASAVADLEVPDYRDQALTVSDFVVSSSGGPTLVTLEEDPLLRSALPAQPTSGRRFTRAETLNVFAEIYDSHWILSQEVGVTLTLAREDGSLVSRGEQVLTTANRSRFYLTATLPLGALAAGDYVLGVEAYTRKGLPANASRQMKFTVVGG